MKKILILIVILGVFSEANAAYTDFKFDRAEYVPAGSGLRRVPSVFAFFKNSTNSLYLWRTDGSTKEIPINIGWIPTIAYAKYLSDGNMLVELAKDSTRQEYHTFKLDPDGNILLDFPYSVFGYAHPLKKVNAFFHVQPDTHRMILSVFDSQNNNLIREEPLSFSADESALTWLTFASYDDAFAVVGSSVVVKLITLLADRRTELREYILITKGGERRLLSSEVISASIILGDNDGRSNGLEFRILNKKSGELRFFNEKGNCVATKQIAKANWVAWNEDGSYLTRDTQTYNINFYNNQDILQNSISSTHIDFLHPFNNAVVLDNAIVDQLGNFVRPAVYNSMFMTPNFVKSYNSTVLNLLDAMGNLIEEKIRSLGVLQSTGEVITVKIDDTGTDSRFCKWSASGTSVCSIVSQKTCALISGAGRWGFGEDIAAVCTDSSGNAQIYDLDFTTGQLQMSDLGPGLPSRSFVYYLKAHDLLLAFTPDSMVIRQFGVNKFPTQSGRVTFLRSTGF